MPWIGSCRQGEPWILVGSWADLRHPKQTSQPTKSPQLNAHICCVMPCGNTLCRKKILLPHGKYRLSNSWLPSLKWPQIVQQPQMLRDRGYAGRFDDLAIDSGTDSLMCSGVLIRHCRSRPICLALGRTVPRPQDASR